MAHCPSCQKTALPWGQVTRNGVVAAQPWLKVPSMGAVAQPAACPSGSLPMSASLPKGGHGHQVHTKVMLLFPNTILGTQPWEEEGWARK